MYFPDLKLVWLQHWTSSARFEYSDPDFQTLLDCLEYLGQNAGIQMPENILPIIAYIPGLSKVSVVVVGGSSVDVDVDVAVVVVVVVVVGGGIGGGGGGGDGGRGHGGHCSRGRGSRGRGICGMASYA